MYKKLLSIFILFLILTSCPLISDENLGEYFVKQKEIKIDPLSVSPPIGNVGSLLMNKKGRIFLGLSPSKRTLVFNKEGNYIRSFSPEECPVSHPILYFNESSQRIAIGESFAKKVLLFDTKGNLETSFLANAPKLEYISDGARFNDKILIGGSATLWIQAEPTKWRARYLHIFNKKGKHLKSVYDAYPKVIEDNRYNYDGAEIAVNESNDRIYCIQTCYYLISTFDKNFNKIETFGKEPKNWKSVSYSGDVTAKERRKKSKYSLVHAMYFIKNRIVFVYNYIDSGGDNSEHMDFPRMCIYTDQGKMIANGIPIKKGFAPKTYLCIRTGINSEQNRLLIIRRENPEREDSDFVISIYKPKWNVQ